MSDKIPASPLSPRGRWLVAANLLGLIGLWLLALAFYFPLPQTIPVHFDLAGNPTRYGSKFSLLLLPAAFSIAPAIILLATRFRFTLVNDYPYLVNLPAFFATHLPKLSPERQSWWINRLFEANLALGAGLTAIMLIIEWFILRGTVSGEISGWITGFILLAVFVPIVVYVLYLRRLGREMAQEVMLRLTPSR